METKEEKQDMLLLHFNPDELADCRTVSNIYATMGISPASSVDGETKWEDKTVFGKRAYYKNMFINDEDYKAAEEGLKNNVLIGRTMEGSDKAEETMMDYHERNEVFSWAMSSPISFGPKYDQIKARLGGDVPRGVLVIVCPDDDLYEEAPGV